MQELSTSRKKRWHTKAKTGCEPCRARRVKCDERKPVCNRCFVNGRECRFSSNDSSSGTSSNSLPSMGRPLLPPQTPVGVQSSEREKQIFHMLRNLTIDQVTGVFDQRFWASDVLQATQSSPIIWHASLAFSAMHYRMKLSSRDPARAGDYHTIALRQYNKAIQSLIPLTSKSYISFTEKQTILLASVLFIGICCMHRNIEHAKLHIANAVELYYLWGFWKYEETAAVVQPRSLLQLVALFQYQLTDVGAAKSAAAQRQIAMTEATISENPFVSVTEAYFEFVHIHFGRIILREANDKSIGRYPMQAKHIAYATCLNRWKNKFRELEKSQESESPNSNLDAIRTLRLLVDSHELCYSMKMSGSPETYVKNTPKLISLVEAAEEILQCSATTGDIYEESFSPVFSFSLSICEVLRVVGLTTLSSFVHQKIINIFKRWPRQDGFLDSQLLLFHIQAKMQFAKLFGAMEIPDGLEGCNCVPEVYICRTHGMRYSSMDISEDRVTIQGTNLIRRSQGLPSVTFTFEWNS